MRIVIIGFTRQGGRTIKRLLDGLCELGYEAVGFLKEDYIEDGAGTIKHMDTSAAECVAEYFVPGNGIIFVGAAGIAVRVIAPLLKGKDKDPAVVVIDEQGRFAVSLLSGHLGGANDVTRVAAGILGAAPVITTATDINDTFAIDLFAGKHHLQMEDINLVKKISASLLDGGEVGFFSELPVSGGWPRGVIKNGRREWNIAVTIHEKTSEWLGELPREQVLCLFPGIVVIGIGCRKGTQPEAVKQAVDSAFLQCGIEKRAAACIASIDLKKDEPCLLAFAEERQLDFVTFSAGELSGVRGDFSESEFVLGVTGVSNVCERAAVLGCGENGRLIMGRTIFTGVTVALAVKEKTLSFSCPETGKQVKKGDSCGQIKR